MAFRTGLSWAVLIAAVAASSSAVAGTMTDPICTDRPGKASSTCSVAKGHVQLETGLADWSLTKNGNERDTELDLGASAIKYGLTDHLHVEIDLTPYVRLTSRAPGARDRAGGFGDTIVALKQELGGSGPLSAALYPFIKIPTANRSIGNGKIEGGFRVPLGLALGASSLTLAATPEIDFTADADGHGHHAAMVQELSLGWGASESLNLSAELWGQWDWDPAGTGRQYSADASAAYLIGKNFQLDGGANFGLNRQTPDIEVYVGFSKRF